MIRGLYNAAGGLRSAELNHEVVAQNLANANMPGFRRQLVATESFSQSLAFASRENPGTGTPVISRTATIFEPGELQFSDKPLDVAIQGDGFFVLDGPNEPLYTRNGVFELGAGGELQTSSGIPVRGESGRINIPPAAHITIRNDGTIDADGAVVGRLRIVRFDNPAVLQTAGTTLFRAPAALQPTESSAPILQGYRESSNVQVVDELVRMIAGTRQYESSQRVLRALSDALEQNTRA